MALQILKTGVASATSGTSAGGVLPTNVLSAVPQIIRVAVTQATYFRIGIGAQTAVTTDMLLNPGDAILISTNSSTHYAALQVTTAGVCQISPVEGL